MTDLSYLTDTQREAYQLRAAGLTQREAAAKLGISRGAYRSRLDNADRALGLEPEVAARLRAGGASDLAQVHSAWLKGDDGPDGARGDSIFVMLGRPPEEAKATLDEMFDDLLVQMREHVPAYDRAPVAEPSPPGLDDHLLVVDPADIHIGKLCTVSETGHTYDSQIAVERMREGVRRLTDKARVFGINRVLLVIGNDILHADRWNNTTTSGTPQDTDGLWHQWFLTAQRAYVKMIEELAREWPVDLVYTPSNHDWQSGFYLAQVIRAWFHNHPNVNASDYYVSPIHRKYYMYGGGLLGFTHGDGAKEVELPNLMQHEVRGLWGRSQYAYWYTHHWHHKQRTRYGLQPSHVEKDLTGLTVVAPNRAVAGDNVEVEVVRSPAAPDGWHHRNGYVNLQAVEVFLHDGSGAQVARLTEWF